MEPFRLREWKVPVGRLFTCGRPGRSKWKDASKVPNDALRKWTQNLPDGKSDENQMARANIRFIRFMAALTTMTGDLLSGRGFKRTVRGAKL